MSKGPAVMVDNNQITTALDVDDETGGDHGNICLQVEMLLSQIFAGSRNCD